MTPKEYLLLKDEHSRAMQKANEAKGALDLMLQNLQAETGVADYDSGKKLLKQLELVNTRLEKEYQVALADFKLAWQDYLEGA